MGLKVINPFKNLFAKKPDEVRNMAVADMNMGRVTEPVYTAWTVKKSVKEGYQKNPWVYRAVYLKAKAGSSVPWFVVDEDGSRIEKHHINDLFLNPHPYISRQDLFELIISWLELTGNSYLKRITVGNKTSELWPISPDRIKPVTSKDPDKWLEGYALDMQSRATYQPEEIIHHKYFNPSNPLTGISPLEAAARTVDVDNAQRDFNKVTAQNRGVVDGIFTFERGFSSLDEQESIRDKLNEQMRGRRSFGVLGSNANYIQTALTPVEMDFIQSIKMNREEIFITFGVPPVYAGVTEAATLNNYKTSELIFWFGTMLFLLDDIKDQFNFALKDELAPGHKITYDISSVQAIREAALSNAETAEKLFKMGVPFEQLNRIFELNVDEFEDWDKSYINTSDTSGAYNTVNKDQEQSQRSVKKKFTMLELRQSETEKKIDKEALSNVQTFNDILYTQKEAIFDEIEKSSDWSKIDVSKIIGKSRKLFQEIVQKVYLDTALKFALDVVLEKRESEGEILSELESYLQNESVVLYEISNVESTTVDTIIAAIESGLQAGLTTKELQQSIIDSGVFPIARMDQNSRALMLARTITGTAANLGQLKGAQQTGATHKVWQTAGFEVRPTHKKMDNVKVKIDEKFTIKKVSGGTEQCEFPLDPRLTPGNRCNCRCAMQFTTEG